MLWKPDGFYLDTSPLGHFPLPPTSSEIGHHVQEEHSWCAECGNYLQQPTNMRQDCNHYSMDVRIFVVALLHSKCLNPSPRILSKVCKCAGKCDTRCWRCHSTGIFCVTFCHGKRENVSCKIIQHLHTVKTI